MKSSDLPPDDERLLQIFKALSNPVRYKLVRHLVAHPHCITGDLVEATDLAQSTTSQHVKVLRDVGLIRGTAEGPATRYCLDLDTLRWFQMQVNAVATELADCC